jgi:hypothetical protein
MTTISPLRIKRSRTGHICWAHTIIEQLALRDQVGGKGSLRLPHHENGAVAALNKILADGLCWYCAGLAELAAAANKQLMTRLRVRPSGCLPLVPHRSPVACSH